MPSLASLSLSLSSASPPWHSPLSSAWPTHRRPHHAMIGSVRIRPKAGGGVAFRLFVFGVLSSSTSFPRTRDMVPFFFYLQTALCGGGENDTESERGTFQIAGPGLAPPPCNYEAEALRRWTLGEQSRTWRHGKLSQDQGRSLVSRGLPAPSTSGEERQSQQQEGPRIPLLPLATSYPISSWPYRPKGGAKR